LTGQGCMLDFEVSKVDGREVDTKKYPIETLFFPNTNPLSTSYWSLTYKNHNPIPITYHWTFYKSKEERIFLMDEQSHYKVDDLNGVILPNEEREFKIYFCPLHAEPYYEYVDFIVENVPIKSMMNPPLALKSFAEQHHLNMTWIPIPSYVGANNQYLNLPFFHFSLRGQGNSKELLFDPPFIQIEETLLINTTYEFSTKVVKQSEGDANFSIVLEGKSSESFEICIETPDGQISDGSEENQYVMD